MKTRIHTLFHRMASVLRERWSLQREYIALQHQLEVLKRSAKRPRFSSADRCVWLLLSRWWSTWSQALEILQADTVRRWQRQGLWYHLRGDGGASGRDARPSQQKRVT